MLPAQARVTRQRVTQEPSTTESAEADAQGGQQDQRAKPSSSWIRSEPQKPQQCANRRPSSVVFVGGAGARATVRAAGLRFGARSRQVLSSRQARHVGPAGAEATVDTCTTKGHGSSWSCSDVCLQGWVKPRLHHTTAARPSRSLARVARRRSALRAAGVEPSRC